MIKLPCRLIERLNDLMIGSRPSDARLTDCGLGVSKTDFHEGESVIKASQMTRLIDAQYFYGCSGRPRRTTA